MTRQKIGELLLNNSTIVLFIILFIVFGLWSPRFFLPENMVDIVKQAAFTGIVAVGMTFVLLTGGIDLSVGSNMYLSAVVAGLLINSSLQLAILPALLVTLLIGVVIGAFNAFCVVRLHILPFMTTLATLVICRGLGTALTSSQQIDFPESMNTFGQIQLLGIPMPVIVFLIVIAVAYFILVRTPLGRQIYAVGNDREVAKKAGINTGRVLTSVYMMSGFCAALAGFVLVSQLGGRLDHSFAQGNEFDAIAAAVLGGTSLFGGVGNVLGTVIGALLIQMVQTGLSFNLVNLYLQPMVQAAIIFLAIFFDSLRAGNLKRLKRRFIRPLEAGR